MDGPAFTNSVSMIFNRVYQEEQLKSLKKRLLSDQNNVLATIVSERLKNNFGLRAMPSLDEVLPFIHFDDSGATHFTLIYTSSLLSPFALICSHYFGRPVMNLQREVYQLLYTNTLNISDSDSSDGESPEAGAPAIMSYANGEARNRSFQETCGSDSAASGSTMRQQEAGHAEEDGQLCLHDSLPSYSASILQPVDPLSSVRAAKQQLQLHESSGSSAVAQLARYEPRERTAEQQQATQATSSTLKEQISKKHKCDRCTKVTLIAFTSAPSYSNSYLLTELFRSLSSGFPSCHTHG